MGFRSILEIREANKNFFSYGAMQFFDSRIESAVLFGRYFITSEQFHDSCEDGPRKYTIREAKDGGGINTVGEFQQFESAEEAYEYLKERVG